VIAAFIAIVLLTSGVLGCASDDRDRTPTSSTDAKKERPRWDIRLAPVANDIAKASFEVTGFTPDELARLARAAPTQAGWKEFFAVYVGKRQDRAERPPMVGEYRFVNEALRFTPRFPLKPGLFYEAVFNPKQVTNDPKVGRVVRGFSIPKTSSAATTVVEHVYPSTNKLPENQLKFYLHFSAPMSRGEAYRHIHLVRSSGTEVDAPFLELDEELWDPQGRRFTLFFDPGRIKRGLKPREEVGPALEEGKSYTLVVDRDWSDAAGNPLKEPYRKEFRVGPPDDQPIDPKTWKIRTPNGAPSGGSKPPEALVVVFPKPLDHALLARILQVSDSAGGAVAGDVSVTDEERRWRFIPQRPWRPGAYEIVVGAELEDLAGNRIGRPFEVDVFHPIERELRAKSIRIPFNVGSNASGPRR
jgi:hypothetical protein